MGHRAIFQAMSCWKLPKFGQFVHEKTHNSLNGLFEKEMILKTKKFDIS